MANFLLSLFHIYPALLFYTDKMNSLSEFLSSPLLDYIPRNSPSSNIERPDEIDILLETLSKSDIQLRIFNRRVAEDLGNDEYQQDQGINVANAADISCYSTCSGNTTDHTSSMSTFAAATETDLKHDLRIYWINL